MHSNAEPESSTIHFGYRSAAGFMLRWMHELWPIGEKAVHVKIFYWYKTFINRIKINCIFALYPVCESSKPKTEMWWCYCFTPHGYIITRLMNTIEVFPCTEHSTRRTSWPVKCDHNQIHSTQIRSLCGFLPVSGHFSLTLTTRGR